MTAAPAPAGPVLAPWRQVRTSPMRRRHLPAVVAVEAQVQDRPWSAGLFESELDQPSRRYLVASSAGVLHRRLLGYGGILLAVDEAHVTTLAVDPAAQGRGVGAHLLLALLEEARAGGATAATLEVRASNAIAQRLYTRFGFAPVGVRPGYYAATREDAIIMWAYDIDRPAFAARLAQRRDELAAGRPPAPGRPTADAGSAA